MADFSVATAPRGDQWPWALGWHLESALLRCDLWDLPVQERVYLQHQDRRKKDTFRYMKQGIRTNWHLVKYLKGEDDKKWNIWIQEELVNREVLTTYINKN